MPGMTTGFIFATRPFVNAERYLCIENYKTADSYMIRYEVFTGLK